MLQSKVDDKSFDNKMKLKFLNKSQNEGFARISVAAFVATLDPTLEELTEIRTAVSEAVSNCIIHAYKEDEKGIIQVECWTDEDRNVIISVTDEGVGIENIEKAKEPLFTSKSDEERSGMGFTVMESFMDRLEVESVKGEGTRVTMIKKLDIVYEL
ncbi:anti-sigma F factor [Anaerovorax odorimutans]|uniref:anti-sigma F factor n=1 Tax=Anaerovorax odorimutans TaxID=109327 RepID=UPI0004127CB4|nr:anti-sigma F factor [Anaerovorax odorimutans]